MSDETSREVVRFAQQMTLRGYAVYPVNVAMLEGRKDPTFKAHSLTGEYVGGWKSGDYPTDPAEIAQHWDGFDGIAVNTGKSGLVVVDVDLKNGQDGYKNLEEWLRDNDVVLPGTPLVVSTPSGGEHRYYRAGDVPVRNLQNGMGVAVDIRAIGGCTFAPPTEIEPGKAYSFDSGCAHVSELPVFPASIAEKLAANKRTGSRSRQLTELSDEDRAFHSRRREDALERVSLLEAGNRHTPMLALANTVFGATAVLGDSMAESESLFLTAYELSGGEDTEDCQRVIADAIRYVTDNPWESTFEELTGDFPSFLPEARRAEFMSRVADRELALAAEDIVKERRRERLYANTVLTPGTLGTDLLAAKPEEELWLVEGLLHWEKCRATVIGQYKAGKSTLVLNLLHALTGGNAFLDTFAVRKPVRVGYVDLELGKSLAYQWLSKMPELTRSNFVFYDMVGQGSQLDMRSELLRRKWAQRLADDGVDLLIIDPMSCVYSGSGVDEHTPEVRSVLDSLDALVSMAGIHGVVVTDHAGHGEDTKTRTRGHSSKMDWLTTRISVVRENESFESERQFLTDGRGTDIMRGRLTMDEDTHLLTLEPTEAARRRGWLWEQRGAELTLAEVMDGLGVSDKPARKHLREAGWVNTAAAGMKGGWVFRDPGNAVTTPGVGAQTFDVWDHLAG